MRSVQPQRPYISTSGALTPEEATASGSTLYGFRAPGRMTGIQKRSPHARLTRVSAKAGPADEVQTVSPTSWGQQLPANPERATSNEVGRDGHLMEAGASTLVDPPQIESGATTRTYTL